MANKTLETNCPLRSTLGNSDVPFTLNLVFPAAVAQLFVEPASDAHGQREHKRTARAVAVAIGTSCGRNGFRDSNE
jgi:hypothetical protein